MSRTPKPLPPSPTLQALWHQAKEVIQDEWTMDFLDAYDAPALISFDERKLKAKLRKMRTMARMSRQLMRMNKSLREQLKDRPRTLDPENPPHIPTEVTRTQVATLAAGGLKIKDIAVWLGINRSLVSERYRDEIELGQATLTKNVLAAYMGAATDIKHPAMEKAARKYLETHDADHWKEVKRTEIANVNGGAPEDVIDVSVLSPDERVMFRAMLEKMVQAKEAPLLTDESIVAEQGDDAA
jgi:hypothetical protein